MVKNHIKEGEMIDKRPWILLNNQKYPKDQVRSPLKCKGKEGICQMCYGSDLTTHQLINRERRRCNSGTSHWRARHPAYNENFSYWWCSWCW